MPTTRPIPLYSSRITENQKQTSYIYYKFYRRKPIHKYR